MVSFFTLIIFFRENKLFQRGWGVFVLLCGDSRGGGEGGGDHLFLAIWKTREVRGGVLSEIPSVVGYGYVVVQFYPWFNFSFLLF